jgi:hypothetical protein
MTNDSMQTKALPRWQRPVAIIAGVFGVMTIFSGGSVLFGPQSAQAVAGDFVPYVVWVNFLSGFLYCIAAVGLWLGQGWARILAWAIAAVTATAVLALLVQVMAGKPFEMRTVGALALRFGLWAAIAMALQRQVRAR